MADETQAMSTPGYSFIDGLLRFVTTTIPVAGDANTTSPRHEAATTFPGGTRNPANWAPWWVWAVAVIVVLIALRKG